MTGKSKASIKIAKAIEKSIKPKRHKIRHNKITSKTEWPDKERFAIKDGNQTRYLDLSGEGAWY